MTYRPSTKRFFTVLMNLFKNSLQLLPKSRYSFVQEQRNTGGGQTFFFLSKWFEKGIISIKDLLTESGNF